MQLPYSLALPGTLSRLAPIANLQLLLVFRSPRNFCATFPTARASWAGNAVSEVLLLSYPYLILAYGLSVAAAMRPFILCIVAGQTSLSYSY